MTISLSRIGLALACTAMLTACGSKPNVGVEYIKTYGLFGKKQTAENSTVSQEQIAQVLSATAAPVELIGVESRSSQSVVIGMERNGAYQTYGTAARQTIVLRDGMLVATRGLGGDLMSVDETALLRMVQNRQSGTARYTMRFLTPDNQTKTIDVSCTVSNGGPTQMAGVTMVNAACAGEGATFTNSYAVASGGAILQGRQWLGKELGYVTNQAMRR